MCGYPQQAPPTAGPETVDSKSIGTGKGCTLRRTGTAWVLTKGLPTTGPHQVPTTGHNRSCIGTDRYPRASHSRPFLDRLLPGVITLNTGQPGLETLHDCSVFANGTALSEPQSELSAAYCPIHTPPWAKAHSWLTVGQGSQTNGRFTRIYPYSINGDPHQWDIHTNGGFTQPEGSTRAGTSHIYRVHICHHA